MNPLIKMCSMCRRSLILGGRDIRCEIHGDPINILPWDCDDFDGALEGHLRILRFRWAAFVKVVINEIQSLMIRLGDWLRGR